MSPIVFGLTPLSVLLPTFANKRLNLQPFIDVNKFFQDRHSAS